MRKKKLIVHEKHTGKRSAEEVFAAVILAGKHESLTKTVKNRQMIILLLGKLKEENAIPVLIELLEDEEGRLQAISALGEFKREEFRPYFERFYNSTHPGWRKYAKIAIKKLDAGILRS